MKNDQIKVVEEARTKNDGSGCNNEASTGRKTEPSKSEISNAEEAFEVVPHLHAKTYLIVVAVCLIYIAQLINVVGAGARAQDIAIALGDSAKTVWLTSAITIFTVVLGPPVSQAADLWGRRWLLISLTTFGAVGSLIVATATSMNYAIAGFCIGGLSFGAQPLLHAVTSEVLPRKHRPFAQAAINLAGGVGGLLALVAGGALTRHGNHEGFRSYWYLATALYTLAALLCVALYTPPIRESQKGLTTMEKIKTLDWGGYVLLASGLVLFCVGLSWSQNPYSWTSAHILAPFLIGVSLVVGLMIYETRFKQDGMFHHDLFTQGWNFVIALICIFIEGLVFFAANNYFAFQVSVLYEADSLRVGIRYGIMFITYSIVAVLIGSYCSTTKQIRIPTIVAFGFMIVFFICMATTTPDSSRPVWVYPIFLAVGLGTCLITLVTAAQLSTPPALIAITTGLMISVRSLGGTVGLAIYNATFIAKFGSNLDPEIASAALPLGLPATSLPSLIGGLVADDTTAIALVPGVTPQIIAAGFHGLLEAYSVGFRFVWVCAGCVTVVGAVLAICLVDPVKEFTMHIDTPAEKEEDLFH